MKPVQTFEDWLKNVDAFVERKAGLSLSDLPDVPLHDWWEDGIRARSAAARALRNARD